MKRGKENETNEQRSNYEVMFGNLKKEGDGSVYSLGSKMVF